MAGSGRKPPRTPGLVTDALSAAGYSHMTAAAKAAGVSTKLLYDICNGLRPDHMRHYTVERIRGAGLWGLFSVADRRKDSVTEPSHNGTVTESSGKRKGDR